MTPLKTSTLLCARIAVATIAGFVLATVAPIGPGQSWGVVSAEAQSADEPPESKPAKAESKREKRRREKAERAAKKAADRKAKKAARAAKKAERAAKKAATAPKSAAQNPWYKGVSVADQDTAKKLFAEGVAQHKQLFYGDAIRKYRKALGYWDHPDIHYNLARAYISLGKSIDAYEHLLSATQYGKVSLTEEDWATAKEYKTLLEGQLARIEVSCAVEGAIVTVDDKQLFRGPGKQELLLMPGPHRIAATRADYLDSDEWLQLNPGERKTIELKPMSLALIAKLEVTCEEPGAAVILDGAPLMACPGRIEKVVAPETPHVLTISRAGRITSEQSVTLSPGQDQTVALSTSTVADMVSVRPWKPWKQWAIVGTGAAIGLAGGLLQWRAVSTMDSYNQDFSELCGGNDSVPGTVGCNAGDVSNLLDRKNTATLENRVGVSLMIVGGVAIVGGVTMALLNQSRLVPRESESAIAVTPTVSAQDVGVVVDFSF